MADVTAKLAEAAKALVAACDKSVYMNDYCGLEVSKSEAPQVEAAIQGLREALAAYEQAQAEPKQAAEPFAYVDRVSLLWLSDEVRTPVARVETSLYKTAPGDGWVGVYLAAPAAQAATPAPAEPVAWFKHGPYEEGEPLSVVFENPHDDECYSALVFADTKAATPAPAHEVLEALISFTKSEYIKHQHPKRYAKALAAIAKARAGQGKEAT